MSGRDEKGFQVIELLYSSGGAAAEGMTSQRNQKEIMNQEEPEKEFRKLNCSSSHCEEFRGIFKLKQRVLPSSPQLAGSASFWFWEL